jgi:hypothetical protein
VGDVHTREFADQSPVFVEPGTDGCHAVDHASAGLVITQHFALANVSDPTSLRKNLESRVRNRPLLCCTRPV